MKVMMKIGRKTVSIQETLKIIVRQIIYLAVWEVTSRLDIANAINRQ
jgi:hypothetical protein